MDINRHIDIMGIVNINDDSFFSGSRCPDVTSAMKRVEAMVAEGATIIDFGACSTRPGSESIGADEEWRRLEPVLKSVRERWPDIQLSIDTYWSSVVRKAYALVGDFIVNDISAGTIDPQMLPTVGDLGLTYVAMHIKGTPETMQAMADYQDVTAELVSYFSEFAMKSEIFGVKSWVLDPGFGFAKTIAQNYELIRNLAEFNRFGRPVLVGVSRKSMIYKRFNITPEESLPATQVLHMQALINGASILRVHDVAEARRTIDIYRMVQ